MSELVLCELALGAGFILYALFAGADFGGGIWTAFAFGPRAGQQRDALFNAIGPVWETNHVWLIFVVVTLFTVFPAGFSALFTTLLTPLVLALVGINFRGAAFAFRHFGRQAGREVPWSAATFEVASVLTPFTLGLAVAATGAGRITLAGGQPSLGVGTWLNPFTLMGGLIGVAICAYLAPVYMTVRVTGELREDFRKEALLAGLVLGGLTTLALPVAVYEAPVFAQRLLRSWPIAFVALAVAAGCATQLFLWRRHYALAQVCSGGAVVCTLGGFAAALSPELLIGTLSFAAAAAPRPTLSAYLAILPIGALILIPSLVYLYWTFRGEPDPERPGSSVK
ncbi:cytochrome d ubiquinol oxidase subunit II [Geomesophilobacter sediminis]|uniref:Cytochrome d ubiquinol oxidase subunit II n=1 Tax=Geomesophilobacter sediminis TaxID=2798584 RepID=A0A8J7ILR2_9BACT|nr:cytochrome d ubiquinol oxidase subunit II [Geomesophilobacter sediminis]MBJ6723543.1 cytochrome d ubiquinol oxidase subunit II [Geomesophilobacter sediminis]